MANRPGAMVPAPDTDLCLNFANTRYFRGSTAPVEELTRPDDLLRWAAKAERLPQTLMARFGSSDTLLSEAIALREAIHRCFAATAAGREPDIADVAVLNTALGAAPVRQCIRRGGWDIGDPPPSANTLLAPVLWTAADLLVGAQLHRVHQCANPECGWLFLDNSKSGNRRWCSMSSCGNRAKAHRHYQRQKGY